MFNRSSALALIIPLTIMFSRADSAVQMKEAINWSRGAIVAYGMERIALREDGAPVDAVGGKIISLNRGRAASYLKAREQALGRMTLLVRGIRVDADTMLTDLLEENDVVQSRIARIIKDRMKFSFFPIDFYTSGCRAELKIGDLIPAVAFKFPGEDFPSRIDNPIPTDYTSLIIDVRGMKVAPMMLPSVFNENGLEVFGRHYVDIRHATRFGIVGYALSEKEAVKSPLAGDHPYYTDAIGEMKGCPVIANRDVRKIFSSVQTVANLKKCRVIFIIDKNTD
jgi:hypothetical protein